MILMRIVGGLGNQLFIYAMARVLQNKYGHTAVFDIADVKEIYELDKYNIDMSNIQVTHDRAALKRKYRVRYLAAAIIIRMQTIIERMFSRRARYFVEKHMQRIANYFGFYLIVDGNRQLYWNTHTKNIIAFGFFQSEKYFAEIEESIRSELSVKNPPLEHNKKYIEMIKNSESVCLHVRRGDFTAKIYQDHLVCTPAYYVNAVMKMRELLSNPVFYVFSDDIVWARKNVPCENAVYVEDRNPAYEDLRLMSMCKHFIISNSSFSWWGQYLSVHRHGLVIAPDRWYNSDKECDIWQDHWIRLPVCHEDGKKTEE